jgi:hypothetical protein
VIPAKKFYKYQQNRKKNSVVVNDNNFDIDCMFKSDASKSSPEDIEKGISEPSLDMHQPKFHKINHYSIALPLITNLVM